MTTNFVLMVTTMPDERAAAELARKLVDDRLAACVNILPRGRSIYRFEGVVEDEPESVLLMKTRRDRCDAVAEALEAIHPYDVPELIVLPIVAGAKAYLSWVDDNVAPEES